MGTHDARAGRRAIGATMNSFARALKAHIGTASRDVSVRPARSLAVVLAVAVAITLSGCFGDAIKQNQQQLAQQQTELDQLTQQVAALKNQNRQPNYSTAPAAPGTCDDAVMHQATQRGGEKFALGDFARALGYYQDAITACPGNAQAELNVARTYEAMGERVEAADYYRRASQSASDSAAVQQARQALSRLGTN